MPLPAALLNRLKKRGIVKSDSQPEVEEEVIAEDYDDEDEKKDGVNNNNNISTPLEPEKPSNNTQVININEPVAGCPNKWNVYHECTNFCLEVWKSGKKQPSPRMEKKRIRMLKKYPLPDFWEEVYDPGTGRFYYWFTKSGEVSWLPPGHPKCKISLPASKLRTLIKDTIITPMEEDPEPSGSEDDDSDEDEEMDVTEVVRRDRHRPESRSRGREKVRENDLDPMDPAAYSEAPRGTWSSGLDRKGEAKTGADTTASGPLYQMRPYPSPGAVLRLNAELKKSDSDDSEDD